jgi:Domain of Unknown Function (DUF1080)
MLVRSSVFASLMILATAAIGQEGKSLFDGKSLSGWEGDSKFWSIQDDAITGKTTKENPTKGNTFLIWKGGEVADFDLTLKFKIVGGNSGIQYRSIDKDNFVVNGYQADIDSTNVYMGILYEEGGRGILAQRGKKVKLVEGKDGSVVDGEASDKEVLDALKKDDWNEYRVVAKGNHLQHFINGKITVDVTDENTAKAAKKGILALQLHAGPPMTVQFKDIVLK